MTTPATLPSLPGLHHVTGITADVQQNVQFYTRARGLRLVKVTINYDDPHSYHLYYGDTQGNPGTILTFFGWLHGRRGTAGTGQVIETAYAVPAGSLPWWQNHLAGLNIQAQIVSRFDTQALLFQDPDGLPLALIETPVTPTSDNHLWPKGGIPQEYAIRGFHGVTLAETDERLPAIILADQFNYREIARDGNRIRYQAAGSAVANTIDVLVTPQRSVPRMGAGQIHHVAFRTATDEQQTQWQETLRQAGHNVSPVMDRDYFHSIYFREPGGTLFEIATDGPGFATNESVETLGTRLMLPAWLEPQRAGIEAALPPLRAEDLTAAAAK